jgi:peptide/nickel transport system permease protein
MAYMKRNSAYASLGLGTLLLIVFASFSLFPQAIAPYGVKEMFKAWQGLSTQHLLGTNDMGYDIFTELVFATRNTLLIGVSASVISLVFGTVIGLWAGCTQGAVGEIAGSIINIFLLIPMLPAAIVVAAYLGPGIGKTAVVIALLGWCPTARAVRARAAQLKQTSFVEALIILQIPQTRIIFCHILPNLLETVLARYILSVSSCIMMESALSFIGLGDPSSVTWGGMVNFAYRNGGFSRGAMNWFLAPGLCITLCALSFRLLNTFFEYRASRVRVGTARSYME